jgi:predicted acylesterase/phospholipase RssA
MTRGGLAGACVAGWLAARAAAAVLGPTPCEDRLPVILRVGLPQAGVVAALSAPELRARVERVFAQVYGQHGLCRESRRLQINVALGNDYQIVDWLAQGRIDVGVTTDVGLFLLNRRDKLSLAELDLFQSPEVALFLPSFVSTLRSRELFSGGPRERPDPAADFDSLLWQIWCQGEASKAVAEGRAGCQALAGGPRYRLEVPSHLSTAGFAVLVRQAEAWLAAHPSPAAPAAVGASGEAGPDEVRERFWTALFQRTRFTFSRSPLDESPAAREIVIQSGEKVGEGDGFRNHLVLPIRLAGELLEAGSYREAYLRPEILPSAWFAEGGPPRAVSRWLDLEPYFGVRTYGFTVGESLALLVEHQKTSGVPRLALVLPGGGVKAVYQSALLDELYGRALLRNVLTSARGRYATSLPVDAVVGTSGGALLGYFVARLGEGGPWNLAQVLWERAPGQTLDSTDIFDWGDLLRYLSAVVIFGVFSCCLALFSFQTARFARDEPNEGYPATRWRLSFALWPILAAAPLLVRAVNGVHAKEHIPAIEGLFYMVCTTIAVFADQCFVERPEARAAPATAWSPLWAVAPGLLLVALPFRSYGQGAPGKAWHEQPLTFLGAFGPLLVLVVGLGFVVPVFRRRTWPESLRGKSLASLAEIFGALLLGAALLALPAGIWRQLDRAPFFLVGFGLIFLLLGFGPSLQKRARTQRAAPRTTYYYIGLLVATLLVALLCRPADLSAGGGAVWVRESRLDLRLGGFLVCLGVLTLLAGALLWVGRSRYYHVEKAKEFRSAFALSLSLVVVVYGVLLVLQAALPNRFSFLELTSSFWLWLLGVSCAVSILLIVAGAIIAVRRPNHRLIRGLRFLCAAHPNGIFVNRRFVRVALVGLGAVGWWNFVLAPALYGNARAHEFLERGVLRFEAESRRANGGSPPRLRAQFLAPANILERDGTRYFLVQPPGIEGCQEIVRQPGSGSVWYQLRVKDDAPAGGGDTTGCPLAVERTPRQLEQVIFASGSPFPIFPAHLVELPGEAEPVALVDGGYSNNVPVAAAAALSAAQVLIVQSTNPLGVAEAPSAPGPAAGNLFGVLHGPLVGDLSRLVGFLFERSQQPDRLSRREVFVVSLSPSQRADWPELFDFRSRTVESLRRYAKEDFELRIGAVESWGPPHFQLSVEVRPHATRPVGAG